MEERAGIGLQITEFGFAEALQMRVERGGYYRQYLVGNSLAGLGQFQPDEAAVTLAALAGY